MPVNQIVKLSIGNVSYSGTATQLNYNTAAIPGTATASKTVVLDSNLNYSGINNLTVSNIYGNILTASQPNITSLGTLSSLTVSGAINMTSVGGFYIDNYKLLSNAIQLNYLSNVLTPGTAVASSALVTDSTISISGLNTVNTSLLISSIVNIGSNTNANNYNLYIRNDSNNFIGMRLKNNNTTLSSAGTEIDFSGYNISDTTNFSLAKIRCVNAAGSPSSNSNAGILTFYTNDGLPSYYSTGYERMRITNTGLIGINNANPTYRLDIMDNNGQILKISTSSYFTKFHVNTIDGSLNILTSGNYVNVQGLSIAGALINATPAELNYNNGLTPGTVSQTRSVVVDSSKNITGFNNLTSTNIFATNLYLNGQPISATSAQINTLITTPGSATASTALILDVNKSITGLINVLNVSTLRLNSSNITVTASQINTLNVTPGYASASSALVTDASNNLVGIANLSVTSLTLNGSIIYSTALQLNYLSGVITPGTASASSALVVDSSRSISNINVFSASTISGLIITGSQPNITSIGTLTGLKTTGFIMVNSNATPNTILEINQNASISNKGLRINFDNTQTLGSQKYTDLYMDSTNVFNISATTTFANGINATILTAAQPNITSIGTLTNLNVTGNISGTILTAAQPNITSVGTLSSLTVSGAINGTLTTNNQPNITTLGTLLSLTVSGALNATISTPAQPNITSVGTLSSLTVSGSIIGTLSTAAQTNITSLGQLVGLKTSGNVIINSNLNTTVNLEINQASFTNNVGLKITYDNTVSLSSQKYSLMYVDSAGTLIISSPINCAGVYGTIMTQAQPNITSIGTLASLTVTGNISGTLTTQSQPNITSIGTLSSLTVTGNISGTLITSSQPNITTVGTLSNLVVSGAISGTIATAAQPNITSIGTLSSLNVAGNISGTILTAAQPNITSLGTLVSLTVSGNLNATLTTASQPNITSLGTLSTLSVSGSINGTLATAAQTNITSIGTLIGLKVSGNTIIGSNLNPNANLEVNQGGTISNSGIRINYDNSQLLSSQVYSQIYVDNTGLLNISSSLSVNGNIIGTLATPSQTNITTIGNLTSLKVVGNTMINSTNTPNANLEINQASATSNYGLRLTYDNSISLSSQKYVNLYSDASGNLNISSSIIVSGNISGTIITGNQQYITNVGTLASLTVSGNISGTLTTASQTNITTLGSLTGLTVAGNMNISGTLSSTNDVYTTNNIGIGTTTPSTKLHVVQSPTSTNSCILITYTPVATTYTASIYLDNTGTLNFTAPLNFPNNSSASNASFSNPFLTGTITINGTALSATAAQLNSISNTTAGTVTVSSLVQVDSSKNISGFNTITATSFFGDITKASQTAITTIGTLTSLTVSGDANLIVKTASQPYITAVGVLAGLKTSGNILVNSTSAYSATANIEINQAGAISGAGLKLTYDNTAGLVKSVTINTDSSGALNINSSAVNIQGNVSCTLAAGPQNNITSLGTLSSLSITGAFNLGGSPVNATAAQLNYNYNVTPGTVSSGSTVVVDSSKNITGFNNLSISGNLSIGGTTLNATLVELNYNSGMTLGIASASKTLSVDSGRNISNINSLSAVSLTGAIQTASQTNITAIGTLGSLKVSGNVMINSSLSPTTVLEVNQAANISNGIKLTYDNTIATPKSSLMYVDSNGNLYISSSLTVSGTSISGTLANGPQTGITQVGTLSSLTVTGNISGTISTPSQTAITSVGTLTSLNVSGNVGVGTTSPTSILSVVQPSNTSGLSIKNGANTTNIYVDATGLLNVSSAVSFSGNISGTLANGPQTGITQVGTLPNLTVTGNISGTLTTAAQTNITSLGVLSGLKTSGNVLINSSSGFSPTANLEINQNINTTNAGLKITYDNTVSVGSQKSSTLYVDSSGVLNILSPVNVTGSITGILNTASQTNITAVGSLTGLITTGNVLLNTATVFTTTGANLEINQKNTSTNAGLKITYDNSAGTPKSCSLYMDSTGSLNLSAATIINSTLNVTGNIYGRIASVSQTAITAVGSLDNLTVIGGITAGSLNTGSGNIITSSGNISTSSGTITAGGVINATAGIVSSGVIAAGSNNIYTTSGNIYTTSGNIGIGTSSPSTQLTIAQTASNSCITLSYLTNTASIYLGSDGKFNFSAGIVSPGGSSQSFSSPTFTGVITFGSTALTVSGEQLNYLSSVVSPGTAYLSSVVVLDANKSITGIGSLSATNLTGTSISGTITTVSQPNITSIGTLSSLIVNGNVNISNSNGGSLLAFLWTDPNISTYTSGNILYSNLNYTTQNLTSLNSVTIAGNQAIMIIGNITTSAVQNTLLKYTNLSTSTGVFYRIWVNGILISNSGSFNYDTTTTNSTFTLNSTNFPTSSYVPICIQVYNINSTSVNVKIDYSGTSISTNSMSYSSDAITPTTALNSYTFNAKLNSLYYSVAGTASANSLLYLDSSRNITNINNLSTTGNILIPQASKFILSSNVTTGAINSFISTSGSNNLSLSSTNTGGNITLNTNATVANSVALSMVNSGSSTNSFTILSNGNFGINMNSPVYTLDVAGSINATNLYIAGSKINSTPTEINYLNGVTGGTVTASKAIVVDTSKNIIGFNNIATTSLCLGTNTSNTTNRFITAYDTTYTSNSSRYISFGQSNSDRNCADIGFLYNTTGSDTSALTFGFNAVGVRMTILAGGNVGIGVSSPAYKLDVGGTLNISSNLYFNGTQVLSTAAELNLLNAISAGSASASKAVILDNSKNIIGLANVGLATLNITSTTSASSTIAGAVTSLGGIAISCSTDATSISNGGSITTAGGLAVAKTTYLGAGLNVSGSVVFGGTNMTSAAWGTTGIQRCGLATTYTDSSTLASGTAAISTFTSFLQPTLVATNTGVTTTNAATVYIGNSPAAGANMTIANSYALWIPSGNTLFGAGFSSTNKSGALVTLNTTSTYTGIESSTHALLISAGNAVSNPCLYMGSDATNNVTYIQASKTTGKLPILINPNGGFVGINKAVPAYQLDVAGSVNTTNLYLNGSQVVSTAAELAYLNTVVAGTATASKALVLDSSSNITGISTLTATNLAGLLTTPGQTNITSLGTLTSLAISNTISTSMFTVTNSTSTSTLGIYVNATGGAQQIGSTTAHDLNLVSNSTIRMTIKSGGSIGINTTSPAYLLDVNGSVNCTTLYLGSSAISSTAAEINTLNTVVAGTAKASKAVVLDASKNLTSINNITSTGTITSSLSGTGFTHTDGIISLSTIVNNTATPGLAFFGPTTPHTLSLMTNGISRLNISSSGNVGLGVTSPAYLLDFGSSAFTMINFSAGKYTLGASNSLMQYNSGGGHAFYVGASTANTAGTMALGITSAGNVGILTSSIQYPLHVTGSVKCTQLLVGTSTDTNRMISVLDSGISNGGARQITFGKANSAYNQTELAYYHSSDGSGDNYFGIGFFGVNPILKVLARKTVIIGDGSPLVNGSNYLEVNGKAFFSNYTGFGVKGSTDTYSPQFLIDFGSGNPLERQINLNSGLNAIGCIISPSNHTVYSTGSSHIWCLADSNGISSGLMKLASSGRLGIGTYFGYSAVPLYPLHVTGSNSWPANNGTVTAASFEGDGPHTGKSWNNLQIGIFCDNTIVGSGYIATSDIRLKTDINDLDLDECKYFIQNSNPVKFKWKDNENTYNYTYGFIAQELSKYKIKNLVEIHHTSITNQNTIGEYEYYDIFNNKINCKKDFTLAVNYNNIIAIHTTILKDVYNEIENNKIEIEELKTENQELKDKLTQLEEKIKRIESILNLEL